MLFIRYQYGSILCMQACCESGITISLACTAAPSQRGRVWWQSNTQELRVIRSNSDSTVSHYEGSGETFGSKGLRGAERLRRTPTLYVKLWMVGFTYFSLAQLLLYSHRIFWLSVTCAFLCLHVHCINSHHILPRKPMHSTFWPLHCMIAAVLCSQLP